MVQDSGREMFRSPFSESVAKSEVAAAIRDVEQATSAEVVVAVRASAGMYRHTDYLVGFAFSFVALLVFLFHPWEFSIDWMPFDSLATFAIGTLASAWITPLRRWLTSSKLMSGNVKTAARAAFVDLRVATTTGRSGVLVFVSMFERRVDVVTDIGLDRRVLGPPFERAAAALEKALSARDPLRAFAAALRALGPILGVVYPHRVDDVNELPDEPQG